MYIYIYIYIYVTVVKFCVKRGLFKITSAHLHFIKMCKTLKVFLLATSVKPRTFTSMVFSNTTPLYLQ